MTCEKKDGVLPMVSFLLLIEQVCQLCFVIGKQVHCQLLVSAQSPNEGVASASYCLLLVFLLFREKKVYFKPTKTISCGEYFNALNQSQNQLIIGT